MRTMQDKPMRSFGYASRSVRFYLLLAILVMSGLDSAAPQTVGVDLCACQPAVYEITLDFTLECKAVNVEGPGILDTACRVTAELEDSDSVTDFVPVAVQDISILELNANLQILQQEGREGSFRSGDQVRYTSVLNVLQEEIDATKLPAALQVVMRGVNAIDQPLQMFWVITYSNGCGGVFPLIQEGQLQGWSIFTDLGAPPTSVCPLADDDTPPEDNDPTTGSPSASAVPSTEPTFSQMPTTTPSTSPSQSNVPSTFTSERPSISSMPSTEPSMPPTVFNDEDTPEDTTSMQPTNGDCTDMVQTCPVGGHMEESKNVFYHGGGGGHSHHSPHPHPPPHHGGSHDEPGQAPSPDMIPVCVQNRFFFWTSYETKCVDRHTFAQEGSSSSSDDQHRLFDLLQCNSYSCGCCDPIHEGRSYPSFCGGQLCATDPSRTFCQWGSGGGRGWGDRCDNYVALCVPKRHHGGTSYKTICVDELDPWFLAKTPGEDYSCGCCEEDDADFCTAQA